MKKAQGISVNVIIIAAIALLVLVVLSVIFIGRMGGWGEAAAECGNKGGKCCNSIDCDCDGGFSTYVKSWSCEGSAQGNNCCIEVGP